MAVDYVSSPVPAFLFDLDGTLIDSVYQHVIAWRAALADIRIDLSVWRVPPRDGEEERRAVPARAAAGDRAVAVQGGHRPAAGGARGAVPGADGRGHRAAGRAGT